MTCGVCHPEGFRTAWSESHPNPGKAARVYGYACGPVEELAGQVRRLYFHGAETVIMDSPVGRMRNRPGFKSLIHPVVLRSGDTLLLADSKAFGTKPHLAAKVEEELQERGVAVWEIPAQEDD